MVHELLDKVGSDGSIDLVSELAERLPALVTAMLLGVDLNDRIKLKEWSASFAEVLGNFQHNPEQALRVLQHLEEMTEYFREAVRSGAEQEGLIQSLVRASDHRDRLTEDEVIANVIVAMVGGQETTTNLIANGMLTLLRQPDGMQRLRVDRRLLQSAVEEMLRYEPPSQQTARLAPSDVHLGGHDIRKGQAVIAVMAASNRDPARFPNPDTFDIARQDNRHLSFGWGSHFCFGAPLARLEARLTFDVLLSRYQDFRLCFDTLEWRQNLGLRGLTKLPVKLVRADRGNRQDASEHSKQEGEGVCPYAHGSSRSLEV